MVDRQIDRLIDLHWVRPPMVPMHPGLIDGPFVPHNLDIGPGNPCAPTKVPDSHTYNPHILRVQKGNPDILFLVCTGTFICAQPNIEHVY
jgi:hypothetical protein